MESMPTVLYVEDDPLSRKIVQLLLVNQMRLPHLHIFEDSTDFISNMRKLDPPPNLILLDIHMKPYTGFEMLEMLRKEAPYRNVPVVALTASVMNEEIRQLEQAGFDGCLGKPINLQSFPDAINRIWKGEKVWRVTT